jgi:opacity protein-like surface antigen
MKKLVLVALLLSLSVCAFGQQDYVGRYDVFTGFSYLKAEKLDLQQRGFNLQLGVNLNRWLAAGLDYSIQEGRASLITADVKPQFQAPLNSLLAAGQAGAFAPLGIPALPANYVLYAPFDATTQTYTAGPQLTYRHFKKVTVFGHPSIGVIHENISLNPHDAFTQFIALPALLGKLPPIATTPILRTLKPNDTTYFYGLGGGADYNLTRHFHIRADVEYVHVFLFSGLLKDSRNSLRVSFGPTFSFGKNVK